MNLMEFTNYKTALQNKVKEASRLGSRLTWKKISERIAIQYTYLSKILNRDDVHMSEDHLHEICRILNLMPDETEYLLTLRGLDTASGQGRKDFLEKKLQALRNSRRIQAPSERATSLGGEFNFVLSPLAWVIYFMLGTQKYRDNPRGLTSSLGIEIGQLRMILQTLHDLGLIEINEDIFSITKINKNHFHYNSEHPLTRLHQQNLRLLCDSHFLRLPEEKRQRFMATFNADDQSLQEIQRLFGKFISEVEKVATRAPSTKTYQLNFELFPWF